MVGKLLVAFIDYHYRYLPIGIDKSCGKQVAYRKPANRLK
jgi:hypothetical protein